MVKGVERKLYEEQLRSLGVLSEEGQALISALWWPMSGHKGMAWSCIRGCLGWVSGKGSSPREWSDTGTGSPAQWSQHLTGLKKRLDNAFRHMEWFLGCPLQGQELDLDHPCGSLPTQHILRCCDSYLINYQKSRARLLKWKSLHLSFKDANTEATKSAPWQQ